MNSLAISCERKVATVITWYSGQRQAVGHRQTHKGNRQHTFSLLISFLPFFPSLATDKTLEAAETMHTVALQWLQ